jgi:hypothetical protein
VAESWLSNSHVCDWYGITCNGDRKVVDVTMVPCKYNSEHLLSYHQMKY